eukprot:6454817-Amphidinium_carterae.2
MNTWCGCLSCYGVLLQDLCGRPCAGKKNGEVPVPHKLRKNSEWQMLVACDAALANILLLKVWAQHTQALSTISNKELLLPCFCRQHRTVNVVERTTTFFGFLARCFCLAKVLSQGFTIETLRLTMDQALDKMIP